jgi:uncharacterized cupin superfamily protein
MSEEQTDNGRRHPNVVNALEVEPIQIERGSRFGAAVRSLGKATGSRLVGCCLYEVPPGRTAFPRHYHCATEEAIYILGGTGTVQIGGQRLEVNEGDYITFPVGPDHAHQLVNSGDGPLRYLCLSNKVTTDVVGYPDSGKIGASGGESTDYFAPPWVRSLFFADSAVDYFDGEPVD